MNPLILMARVAGTFSLILLGLAACGESPPKSTSDRHFNAFKPE